MIDIVKFLWSAWQTFHWLQNKFVNPLFIEHPRENDAFALPFLLFPIENCCLHLTGTMSSLTKCLMKVSCAAEVVSEEELQLKSFMQSCSINWLGWRESAWHTRGGRPLQAGGMPEVRSGTEVLGGMLKRRWSAASSSTEGAEVWAGLELRSWPREDQMTELDAEPEEK